MRESNPEPAMNRGAVDTHAHLFLLESEPGEVVQAALEAGVGTIVCVGIDPETSRRSLELADALPGVFATAGLHPHDASGFDRRAGAAIEELLHDPRVVGVGECGLDFFRWHSPREDQEAVFRTHVALSRESGKPLVVHCRDAWEATLDILQTERAERVVLHCFTGDETLARECVARGFFLSFAGNLTYPKNGSMRTAAAEVPPDRLLVETDCPYLSPQSRRGRDNAPEFVSLTIEALAEIRGTSVEEMTRVTAENAFRAFSLP
ncbi:MAG: TatD family hydrolase [Actinomycetota bacterium]